MDWPERELQASGTGLRSFQSLCERCDRSTLVMLLAMLTDPSWNRLDNWKDATGGRSPAKLRKIVEDSKGLIDIIKRLRETPFVNSLAVSGVIGPRDLLHWRCDLDERFAGLLKLAELARSIGPKKRPDFDEVLTALTEYTQDRWHRPMHSSIEEVLNGLGLSVNLKQRRYDRSETRREVRKARQNS